MGFTEWMARKGNVGGTARWAAKGYKLIKSQNPTADQVEIYRLLIKHRYAALPNPRIESFILAMADKINGLRGLVVIILDLEAGFTENTPQNQQMFMRIIVEELQKSGITLNEIYGDQKDGD